MGIVSREAAKGEEGWVSAVHLPLAALRLRGFSLLAFCGQTTKALSRIHAVTISRRGAETLRTTGRWEFGNP
jgi:hypothetical protein